MGARFAEDVRFALRQLRKSPILTVVLVLSLALGIGATTAVFSLVDGLLLRPLPAIGSPQEVVAVVGVQAKDPARPLMISWADYIDYAGRTEAVRALAATVDCDLSLNQNGPAERISGLAVSGNYFTVLRLTPAAGRLFSAADERSPVAVLGYGLWQRRLGGDPAAVGSAIRLNGKSLTVVGIAPRGFAGTDLAVRREIWLPLGAYSGVAAGVLVPFSGKHDREQQWLNVIGRLAPGVTVGGAQAALGVTARRLAAAYPKTNAGRTVRVLPLAAAALGHGSQARPLLIGFAGRLSAVVGLVLAVAALNVAGLLWARALSWRREIAVRLSLGAGRSRLLQQLLVEGLVLGFWGAVGGIALAMAGLPLLERIELPVSLEVRSLHLSGRVLGFALLVSLASCLVFALVPALQATRTELVPALRGEAPRGGRLRWGLREILAAVQVAAALLILTAAGLLVRTMANLRSIDPGFAPAHVLATTIDLSPAGYEGPRVTAFYSELLDRLRHLPGVVDASMASALPVMGADLEVDLSVAPEGAPPSADPVALPSARHVLVGSRYFQTVGMKILRGRDFAPEDDHGMGAVILNQTAARRIWPRRDALGRRLRLAQTAAPFAVVGVVADATYASLKEKAVPVLYLAHAQSRKSFIGEVLAPQMTLLVRTAGLPRRALGGVREAVRELDPRLPVFRTTTLEEQLTATVGVERQAAALYSGLAVVAVALAMLGLYGALTHTIVERRREIGVRMACGASPAQVRRLVMRRCALLALCGVAAGLALALPADRLVASLLYGVAAYDPVTWLAAALALVITALLVSAAPAGRAARIDPVQAIRHE